MAQQRVGQSSGSDGSTGNIPWACPLASKGAGGPEDLVGAASGPDDQAWRRRSTPSAWLRRGVEGTTGTGIDELECAAVWDTGRGAWAAQEAAMRSGKLTAARERAWTRWGVRGTAVKQ